MKQKFDLMGVVGLGKKKGPVIDPKYATLNRRMFAATIDSVIILLLIAPLSEYVSAMLYHPVAFDWNGMQAHMRAAGNSIAAEKIFWREMNESGELNQWLFGTTFQTLILCVLTALCWHRWAATPGKLILRMRIVDATTETPISNRQIILRLMGYFISAIGLCGGFFWIGFDKRHQGWHDKIASTVVLYVPKKKSAASDQAL